MLFEHVFMWSKFFFPGIILIGLASIFPGSSQILAANPENGDYLIFCHFPLFTPLGLGRLTKYCHCFDNCFYYRLIFDCLIPGSLLLS